MKIIILDRDGVINQDSDAYVKNEQEWHPIPGSCEAIATLCRHGYQVYVATNQSGLGRGYFSQQDLDAMHHKMTTLVEQAGGTIAGIFYCPHTPEENCNCRKPLPGLLEQIAQHCTADLNGVPMVGDSLRDLQAGIAKGCTPMLVKTGKGKITLATLAKQPQAELRNAKVFDNLTDVVNYLVADSS